MADDGLRSDLRLEDSVDGEEERLIRRREKGMV